MKRTGRGNRGYEIGGHKNHVVQDSPKENYILCDSCEKYFAALESCASDTFKNWQRKTHNGEFLRNNLCDDLGVVDCESSNPAAIRLLVYSMFWRAGISSHEIFIDYSPGADLMDQLRDMLLLDKNTTMMDTDNGHKPPKKLYPIVITTCDQMMDESAAVLAALSDGSPCSLIVDRFAFLLFEDRADVPDEIKEFTNNDANDCRFLVLSYPLWYSLTVTSPIDLIIQQTKIRSTDK